MVEPVGEKLRVSSYSRRPTPLETTHYGALIKSLVAARRARGLTQEMLDDELGVSSGLVAKWESFKKLPGAFMLVCWCLSLGVTLTAEPLKRVRH